MRIGICSPISLLEFTSYLRKEDALACADIRGLLSPSVDAVVHGLLRAGHHVVVFTLDFDVPTSGIVLKGEHLTIYIGHYRRSARMRGLTFFYSEIAFLKSAIEKEQLDVIHAHWTYEFAIAALAARCPVFCTVRDVAEVILKLNRNGYRLVRYLMNCWLFRHGERIWFIANSPYTAEQLKRYHPKIDFTVIPNPVNLSRPKASPKTLHPSIVTISNGWTPRKNIDALIEAFVIAKKKIPSLELMLVGKPFVRERCVARLENLGIGTEGIRFMGHVPHDRLVENISSAWIMVHPALEESFGNTLVESMACSVPVVGGEKSGSVPWVLGYGKGGILCDVTNPQAIAKKIVELLEDRDLRSEVGIRGYAWAQEHFAVDAITERTLSLYRKALP